jgi:hypothetical protein
MDQKLFEQLLTEVAEWHRERYRGESRNSTVYEGCEGEHPTYILIDRIKPKNCPYQADKKDCHWKIYKKKYQGLPKYLIQKCETCGALMTPKGKFIAKPENKNYPLLIHHIDRDY